MLLLLELGIGVVVLDESVEGAANRTVFNSFGWHPVHGLRSASVRPVLKSVMVMAAGQRKTPLSSESSNMAKETLENVLLDGRVAVMVAYGVVL